MKRISIAYLEEHEEQSVCWYALLIARKHWPDGIPVTLGSARKAARLGLDADWLRPGLAPEPLAQYELARAEAEERYAAVEVPAWEEYLRHAPADEAWMEYQRVRDPAYAEYLRAKAEAMCRIVQQHGLPGPISSPLSGGR